MPRKSSAKTLVRYTECPNRGHFLLFPLDDSPELVDCIRCKGCGKQFEIQDLALGLVDYPDAAVGLTYKTPAETNGDLDELIAIEY